jgi:Arc/MetJ family transcription regulator
MNNSRASFWLITLSCAGEVQPSRLFLELSLHIKVCENLHMATNLALDDKLVEEARRTGGHKTKREAVNAALDDYIRHRKQLGLIEAFGSFDFDPEYDYKAGRFRTRQ